MIQSAAMDSNRKEYPLPRDISESERLNSQHEAFVSSAGFLLHPRIVASTLSLAESPQVADIATGTGVWLLALEREMKDQPLTWHLSGLDISAEQFPTSSASKSSCRFSILDIRQPIPQHLKGSFHVVHIRLLVGGLTTPDWSTVAQNAFDLLKPGGWIQWHEFDVTSLCAYPGRIASTGETGGSQILLNTSIPMLQRVDKCMKDDMPLFKSRVEGAGFINVDLQRPSSDRIAEMREKGSLGVFKAVSATFQYLLESDAEVALSEDDADSMIECCRQELEDGRSYWRWDMYIVTGQKPF